MKTGNIYIDCGTSKNAVKAALAAFVALGGVNKLNENSLKGIGNKQGQGIAQGICMYSYGTISYSDTKWFDVSSEWTKAGDLSALTYAGPIKPVNIRLTDKWTATVGASLTEVGCQVVPNENVLKVAEIIEGINKEKGK